MYATVEQMREYAIARGLNVPSDDGLCLQLLTVAHDWIEVQSYVGNRAEPAQVKAWPRRGVFYDGFAIPSDEIPQVVINAEIQIAIDSQTTDFLPVGDGRETLSEEVEGAVSVTYAETGATAIIPDPVKARMMLRPLLTSGYFFQVGRV
ncbi:DnaT-like ssDNA-binding protein [Endozoicomonas sp. ONNA1]|uniref:DnaT-like ssDNA-binding protein n=1 Tax=Endozoicomonas sp. ONNA1 TaxID=2828740 RepID=UPI002148708B|nr:DnaT-like ssDNA-binding protein [Endozoicomonas sp. ONNA1]